MKNLESGGRQSRGSLQGATHFVASSAKSRRLESGMMGSRAQIVNYRQTLHAADDGKVAAVPTSQNDERRAWIAQARHFVSITVRKYPDQAYFRDQLKSDQIFYRLRPYLSDHFKQALTGGRMLLYPSQDESQMPGIATLFLNEIERLEKEWGLQG
jgi:hypothetical protein